MVLNEFGIHARPAAKISQMAGKASKSVWIHHGPVKADATSILDILSLCCTQNSKIVIEIETDDDITVLDSIIDFFNSGFGEINHEQV